MGAKRRGFAMKKTISCLLSLLLLLGLIMPAAVYAAEEANTIYLSDKEALTAFSSACTLDTYSMGKTFVLTEDVDLSGTDLSPIPVFYGTFDGGGHTISGLSIEGSGSRQGLFRYVMEGAYVKNLHVSGNVAPGGTASLVGGIAGENHGTINECTFTGTVGGVRQIGGIAGLNGATGLIICSTASGDVTGEHQVGGIAGENAGVLLQCENTGSINTVPVEPASAPSFDISSLSAEDIVDITDIGGIAGRSGGTVQNCKNTGSVGYAQIGYNVGGIVGRQAGYISGSENYGTVKGRKDVGGIVGQMEPYANWDFSKSKLEALETQILQLQNTVDSALQSAGTRLSNISAKAALLRQYTKDAQTALKDIRVQVDANADSVADAFTKTIALLRGDAAPWNRTPPLLEQLTAIRDDVEIRQPNAAPLVEAINGAYAASSALYDELIAVPPAGAGAMEAVMTEVEITFDVLLDTVKAVGNVNGDYTQDISVSESYTHNTGAVASCVNYGPAEGDENIGGIVGAMSFEVAFDLEDSLQMSDYLFTDAKYRIFSVARDCASYADVLAKKNCAGGIVGSMLHGAVLDCTGAGTITSQEDNAGGIAGISQGSIVKSYARATLKGEKYVGGIAGSGKNISRCLSYTVVEKAAESYGSVAGAADGTVEQTYFVENAVGGIDNISYKGKAEPISYEAMVAMESVPEIFCQITVTFVAGDEIVAEIPVSFGGKVESLPQVPNDGELYWKWDDFKNDSIYASITVEGKYCSPRTSLASEGEVPMFLVEGTFYENQALSVTDFVPVSSLNLNADTGYTLQVNDYDGTLTVHMKAQDDGVLYKIEDEKAVETAYTRDGSYIVFPLENGESFLLAAENPSPSYLWVLWIVVPAALTIGVIFLYIQKNRKKLHN